MRHVAVVGSGPAGFYTAEALTKTYGEGVGIDILDRLPVPYGLIRFGVAPDHQSIKAVARRYEKVALSPGVRFLGNVHLGADVSIEELLHYYDAVVLATGAPLDRRLGIPGDDLPGVIGSAAFVGWYNGHPDFADLAPPLDVTHAAHDRHRVRVPAEAAEEIGQLLVHHGVPADRIAELVKGFLARQVALEEEIGDLHEARLLGQLVDGVTAMEQDSLLTIDVGDGALAAGCGGEARVIGEGAGRPIELSDVDHVRPDASAEDRQRQVLVPEFQRRILIRHHFCSMEN